MEKRLTRRVALSSLGLISGGILASGCTKGLVAPVSAEPVTPAANGNGLGASSEADHGWKYAPLNAEEIADRAYAMYPDGGCMYSMVGSVISALAERFGEPFSQFPYSMMRYGEGGLGKWGSLCGVVNGAAALIGCFIQKIKILARNSSRPSLIGMNHRNCPSMCPRMLRKAWRSPRVSLDRFFVISRSELGARPRAIPPFAKRKPSAAVV